VEAHLEETYFFFPLKIDAQYSSVKSDNDATIYPPHIPLSLDFFPETSNAERLNCKFFCAVRPIHVPVINQSEI